MAGAGDLVEHGCTLVGVMDDAKLLELLARREGDNLDFKSEPYANNEELTKDIMAIANTLARGMTGYILLGTDEDPDTKLGLVTGIGGHLDDADYQQKVKGKLNRMPQFTYVPLQHDGGKVGALVIEGVGERPYFPITDRGCLRRHIARVRVGSSTDIPSPAQMIEWWEQDNASVIEKNSLELRKLREEQRPRVRFSRDGGGSTPDAVRIDYNVQNVGQCAVQIVSARIRWGLQGVKVMKDADDNLSSSLLELGHRVTSQVNITKEQIDSLVLETGAANPGPLKRIQFRLAVTAKLRSDPFDVEEEHTHWILGDEDS